MIRFERDRPTPPRPTAPRTIIAPKPPRPMEVGENLPLGVSFLVGWAVRTGGKGTHRALGIMGRRWP